MRQFLTLAIVLGASVTATMSARAADFISYPTSANNAVPVASTQPGFDWNGFYAGVYGAYRHGQTSGSQGGVGVDLGVNTTFNYVLAGAEIAVEGLTGDAGTTAYVQGLGRAGVLVTDNALLYGAAGYGLNTGAPNESDALVGAGLEYAVTDSVTLRGQYLHSFPTIGANPKDEVTLGAQFHF